MKKTLFKNLTFYWLLIGFIITMLVWNGYIIISGNMYGVIPVAIQLILLYLLFDKNQYAKIGIKIWSIFFMIGPGLQLLGGILKTLGGENFNLRKALTNLILITIGILIFYFNNKTVEVKIIENK